VVGFCQDEKVLPIYTWRFAMNCLKRRGGLRFLLLLMMIVGFAGVSMVKAGAPWDEIQKVVASDGADVDIFGSSSAISGNIAIFGAPSLVGNAVPGAAYVFDATSGAQLFKLVASDGAAGDLFGFSVAISGNIAIVGADRDDDNGEDSGSAYVFDVTTGQQLFKLVASDGTAGDSFGNAVTLEGNIAVVGAPLANGQGNNTGAAYVFDVTTGTELLKLSAGDGASNDRFGHAVGISGNTVVVGAWSDDDNGVDSGSAYLFDVTTGQQIGSKILAFDGAGSDEFGATVAISGNTVVVGSPDDDDNGTDSGSAYCFDVTSGQLLFKVVASDGTKTDRFGNSVSISGNTAVIGSRFGTGAVTNSGSAFVVDVTTGQEVVKLFASDGATADHFGESVAIDGDLAVIGASFDDGAGTNSGSGYVYQQQTSNLLTITPEPLVGGQNGTFSMKSMLPREMTWLLYSLDGLGSTFIPQLNVTVDLKKPVLAFGPKRTDGNGDLLLVLPIPNVPKSINIWFQSVQQQNLTNFVATQIVP